MNKIIDKETRTLDNGTKSIQDIELDGVIFTNIKKGITSSKTTTVSKTFSLLDVDVSSAKIIKEEKYYIEVNIKNTVAQMKEVFNDGRKHKVFNYESVITSFGFENEKVAERFMVEFIYLVKLAKGTNNNTPLFLHSHLNLSIKTIPQLNMIVPLDSGNYSELSIIFILSFYLGMLVRYFPTHWTALVNGYKGDIYGSILKKTQKYIEEVFPKLVSELILDILED